MGIEFLPQVQKYQQVAYVYAIFCVEGDLGYLKVGYSIEPLKRVCKIAGGSPFTPERIGVVKTPSQYQAHSLEQQIHRSLRARQVAQEWFKYDLKDEAQKKEFDALSQNGFNAHWDTFPFSALKEMNRRESLAQFHAAQGKNDKSKASNKHDATWRAGRTAQWP